MPRRRPQAPRAAPAPAQPPRRAARNAIQGQHLAMPQPLFMAPLADVMGIIDNAQHPQQPVRQAIDPLMDQHAAEYQRLVGRMIDAVGAAADAVAAVVAHLAPAGVAPGPPLVAVVPAVVAPGPVVAAPPLAPQPTAPAGPRRSQRVRTCPVRLGVYTRPRPRAPRRPLPWTR
ncbi:hypothetical protein CAEBREN_14423 [Caenorhabditis brenneri]|uniref:Uncharacterized protein n=1 Tax=Caenorhabditis brenneri TaxID=135651 RepID=G0MMJ5_CAEBE|nr:hypothetical protein CAEBREN_14423 [Caenorhabditis brenneri]